MKLESEEIKALHEIVCKELPPKEELDRAWGIFMKLPKGDRLALILYLTKKVPQLCETQFFVKAAADFKDLTL